MNEDLKKIVKQNETIISLLGRMAFTKEQVREIVVFKKRNPEKYVEGYNSCDGNHSVSDLARIIGVTQGTLSPILTEWEDVGIVREVEKPNGKFYKRLIVI
jgi:DNA-binding MarR family transcriptional regulator